MAYSTGTAATLDDLMTALLAFAVDNGFTPGSSWSTTARPQMSASNTGTWSVTTVSKGGVHFTFQYDTTDLWMNTATAVSGSGAIQAQTGAAATRASQSGDYSQNMRIRPVAPPYVGYHFFSDTDMVHAAVELVAGVFTHLSFGMIPALGDVPAFAAINGLLCATTPGDVTGGADHAPWRSLDYDTYTNTQPAGVAHVRSPVTGVPVMMPAISNVSGVNAITTPAWVESSGIRDDILNGGANTYNGRAPLIPIDLLQSSANYNGPYYQLGQVSNARFVCMANLDPKEVVNTDWMVFPMCQKNGSGVPYLNSENFGIAYKK